MSNLLVFSTGSNVDLFVKSCQRLGITPELYDAKWTGYVTVKLREGVKFLTSRLRREQYCMWVDSNDSLVVKPEDEILARLHAVGDSILISAEKNCWPDADLATKYPKLEIPPHLPHFINAGGFIGPISTVLTAMHTAIAYATSEDDQRAWTAAYLAKAIPDLQIDYHRRLFSCVADGEDALKANTCVLHFNGRVGGRNEYYETLA